MPGFILHLGATVICSHGGQATPSAPFPRVLVSGQPTDTENAQGDQKGKVILQNVRVLATGKDIEQKDEKPVEVPWDFFGGK